MTNYSFEIRSVQLTLVSFLSILSSFYFKFTTFGEPANEAAYDAALKKGKDELQQSYNEDNSAREASKAAKAICEKDKDHASKSELKHLNRKRKEFTGRSEVLAHNALTQFRLAEAIMPERPEAIFGEGLALLQLKEYCSAIKKIESVREANYEPPGEPAETTFALGAALVGCYDVGSKELQVGINLLEEYIKKAGGYPKDACKKPQGPFPPKPDFPNLCAANDLKDAKTFEKLEDTDRKKNKEPNSAPCPLPIRAETELPFTASISS